MREKIPVQARDLEDWSKQSGIIYSTDLEKSIKAFMPYTKETIHFLFIYDKIQIDKNTKTIKLLDPSTSKSNNLDIETKECFAKAEVIGRMLRPIEDDKLIYECFNLKPF